jgi:multiple sugar transport system permease protein
MDTTCQRALTRPWYRRAYLRENLEAYLFLAPWLTGLLLFTAGPMLGSAVLALTDWNLISPPRLTGLGNFFTAITDELFWTSLYNTAYYTFIGVPIHLLCALLAALALNQRLRWMNFYRTMVYLPSVTPVVASAFLWQWIFNPDFGLANAIIEFFGFPPSNWIWDPTMVKPSLILMSLWGIGPQMVIILAGLQNVPEQLIEAASVDGAGVWHRFWHVTLPMISPTIFFCLIVAIIGSFQVFTIVYIMTNQGGPANASLMYVMYLYQVAWESLRMGYASALAWILFTIILVFTIIQLLLAKRWVYYEAEELSR